MIKCFAESVLFPVLITDGLWTLTKDFPTLYFSTSLMSITNIPKLTMILRFFLLFENLHLMSSDLFISVPFVRLNQVYTVFSLRFWATFRDGSPSLLFSHFLSWTQFMMAWYVQRLPYIAGQLSDAAKLSFSSGGNIYYTLSTFLLCVYSVFIYFSK